MSQDQNKQNEMPSRDTDHIESSPSAASPTSSGSDVSSSVPSEAPVKTTSTAAFIESSTSNGKEEVLKGAVERNADSEEDSDENSPSVESESMSAIDELNRLYQQMTVARDPTVYLSHFSAYFQQIFNFKHDTPAANRAVFNSDANLHYFIKIMIPNLVRFFLTMDPTPHPRLQAPVIQRFLQACIVTCIHAIHFDCNELLLTLAQLLGAPVIDRSAPAASTSGSVNVPRSFYLQCGQPRQMKNGEIGWEEDTWVATDKIQPDVVTRIQRIAPAFPAAISPATAGSTSAATSTRTFVGSSGKRVLSSSWYLLQNVQFFGEQGGFHCIVERIKRATAALKQKTKLNANGNPPSSSPTTAQPSNQTQSPPASPTASSSSSVASNPASSSTTSVDETHFSLSLVHLIHLLNPLVEIRFLLAPSFIQSYVLEVKDAVFGYLLNLDCDDDLLKSINRKMLSRPLLQVELLMNVCQPTMTDAEIRKYLELFELDFSWMYVKNKAVPLDRRINAMNDIKDVIDCTEKKEEHFRKKSGSGSSSSSQTPSVLGYVNAAVTNSLNMNEPAPAYTKIWMTNESLCKWIIANRVVEELLDTSTAHIELIRRSLAVMRALSLPSSTSSNPKGASSSPPLLSPAHLDLLWQLSCIGKHESIEHLIYDIVAKLSPSLPAPLMNHLFQRMCEKPMSTYDTIFLTLLYNFTLAALSPSSAVAQAASKGDAQQTYGLELFWKLLQIDSKSSQQLSEEVRGRAQKYFLDLLQLDQSMEGLRLKYLDRCIANIKISQQQLNVTQALQLLLKILQMFPMKSSGWFGSGSSQTQPAVIENLEQKYGLLNLILNEIQAFQARAKKEFQQQAAAASTVPSSHTPALSPPSSASSSPSHSSAASALKQYQEQIEIREEALVSILTHSNLTLSKSQLDLVWQSLVIDCHDQHVKDGVFAWLIDGCGNDDKILKEEEKSYLFQSKLLTLHAPTMSSMAFKVFLQYFLNIFTKNGTLKVDENVVYQLNRTNGGTSEFDRVLAKHRSGLNAPSTSSNSKASSSALPSLKPQLVSSVSELSAAPIDYASTTDEDQLAKSPQFETTLLARTQQLCNAVTVLQYSDNIQICIAFLWEIVLKNVRARVARQSIILLNSLHQNLSGKSRSANESPSSIRDAYLKQCLSHMSQSLQEAAAATQSNGSSSRPGSMQGLSELAADLQAKKKVSRCIYMLKTYLNAFLNKPATSSSSSSVPVDGSISLHIIPTREYRIEPFDLIVKKSDTIGELRTAVFAHLSARNPNISQKSMMMMWDSKKLLTNYIVLGNVGFKNGDPVLVKRNSDLFGSYQPSAAVYTNPSATLFTSLFFDVLDEPWQDMQGREKYLSASIMERSVVNEESDRSWSRKAQDADSTLASIASDPASFDRLFSLLSANSPISESVFDILMLLPTNLNSLRTFLQIQSLNPDKWGMILDVKSMYRLLYSLQVIEEIISPRINANNRNALNQALGPDAARTFDLSQWCVHFIQKGGVKYLAQLIIHFSAPPASPVRSATSSKRGSGVVPRAIYNEVLQSLFTLLHYFFSFDPNWSIPTSSISTTTSATSPVSASSASSASMIHLPAGSWFKLPNWESWLKQVVKEGIIPAMMHAFANLDQGADSQASSASEENTTSMLIAGNRLLLGCVQAVPSILESVFYKHENQTLELLTVLLMKSSSEAVRTQAAQTFYNIFKLAAKQQQQPQATQQYSLFWLNIMQQLLTSPSLLANGDNAQEFFLLYTSYLELLLTSNTINAQIKLTVKQHLQSSVLFSAGTQLLREHVSTEQYEQYLKVDMFLTGILQLLRSCVTYKLVDAPVEASLQDPQSPLIQLVSYVYNECLFFTPADDAAQGAKCKTHSSRIMAFGLLLELASVFETCYARLLEKVAHDRVWLVARNSTQWGYDPTQLEKNSSIAPLGLKNQGATCYMNSFLQVLFSAKEFRQAIMSLKTESDGPSVPPSENKSAAVVRNPAARSARGSALRELQLLFGHLAWSQKSFFDAIDFCYSLKDYNGMPLNIAEQKDVNEFASLLFDQIEQDMNRMCKPLLPVAANASEADAGKIVPAGRAADTNTISKKVIEHTFKGSLVHQIISQNNSECPHTTCREEPFYMISLTVVNKTSMEQSLAGFIEGDLLDGDNKYLCNLCNKKVAALKRCCFHDTHLPQYLIMHLKRFEFNFDQFVKVKVNDYFSFPYKDGEYLNIERFTQSGLAKAEASSKGAANSEAPALSSKPEGFYDYELVGVLIHGGSAEGGHYVTLCKTEIPVDPTSATASAASSSTASTTASASSDPSAPTSAFYEFNDQVVRPFDPASIPASCFGGVEKVEVYDKLKNTTVMKEVTNIKNAYMCIYKRRWKPTAEEEAQEAAAVVAAATAPVEEKKTTEADDVVDDAAPSLPSTPRTDDLLDKNDDEAKVEDIVMYVDTATTTLGSAHTPASDGESLSPLPSTSSASSSSALTHVSTGPRSIWSYDRSRNDLSHFPTEVLESVWQDNLSFLHDKYLFDWNMNWFMWNLLQLHLPAAQTSNKTNGILAPTTSNAGDQSWSALHGAMLGQIGIKFVFQVLARSADNASFPQWIDLLYQLLDWDVNARTWFLQSLIEENAQGTTELSPFFLQLMFDCPQQIVREAFGDFIVFVVSAAREDKNERALYFESVDDGAKGKLNVGASPAPDANGNGADKSTTSSGSTLAAPTADHPKFSLAPTSRSSSPAIPPAASSASPFPHRSRVIRLLKSLLDFIPHVKKYHRNYKEYWRMMYQLAKVGSDERKWLVQQGTIRMLIQFYLDAEPLTGFNCTSAAYGSTDPPRRKHVTSSFWMLHLLSLLIRSCETDALPKVAGLAPSQAQRNLVPLSPEERQLILTGWAFPLPAAEAGSPPIRTLFPWCLSDRQNPVAICELCVHWCWEQLSVSCKLIDLLIKQIIQELTSVADMAEYKLLFKLYMCVLTIGDSVATQTSRVEYGLNELFTLLKKVVVRAKVGDEKLLFFATQHILKLAYQSKCAAAWLTKNENRYASWWNEYRQSHVDGPSNSR